MDKYSWLLITALLISGLTGMGCAGDGDQDPAPDASTTHDAAVDTDALADHDLDGEVEDLDVGAPSDSGPDQPAPDSGRDEPGDPDVGIECITDGDCTGSGCLECSSTGTCIPCTCRISDDCPDNMICDTHTKLCVPHCQLTGCPRDRRCSLDTGTCDPIEGCVNPYDCPEGEACFEGDCVATDANNSCQGEPTLLEPGVQIRGTTMRHRHLTPKPTCAYSESPEAIFTFILEERARVTIVVEGEDLFDPLVYVRRDCDDPGVDSQVICQDWPNIFMEVVDLTLDGGQYYLFVESFAAEAVGNFTVLYDLTPPGECVNDPLEPNDTPATAKDINLARGLPLVLCPGDVDLFLMTLKEGDGLDVDLELIPDHSHGGDTPPAPLLPELSLQDRNGHPVAHTTTQAGPDGDALALTLQSAPASTTYMVSVTWNTNTGNGNGNGDGDGDNPQDPPDTDAPIKYRLTYRTTTKQGTTDCVNPTTLEPGVPMTGDTGEGINTTKGSCSALFNHQAPEVVYKFTLERDSMVNITMESQWDGDMYLRSTCDDHTTEIDCVDSNSSLHQPSLPAGTYYLFVDGHNYDTSGTYQILLELDDPVTVPPNDTCPDSLPILMGQTVHSTTRYATNKYDATCTVRIAHQAPDLVWHFELEEPTRVKATVDTGDTWDGAIYLRRDCAMRNTEVACSDRGEFEVDLLPGTYYLFVDGWSTGYGPFTLTLDQVNGSN